MAANRIFLDLETTGLTPAGGYILEVAVVATSADAQYRELALQSWVLHHDLTDVPMDPAVVAMHTASGLLFEVPFGQPPAEVEDQLAKFISYFGDPAPGRQPLCGSSVHFDAAWLRVHMPRVSKLFGHRTLCASGVRAFMDDCGRPLPKPSGEAAHRALADIRHSIQTLRDAARLVRG